MKLGELSDKIKGVVGIQIFKECMIDECTNPPEVYFKVKSQYFPQLTYFICQSCIDTIENHCCKDEDCWRGEQAGVCKLLREKK